MLLLTILCLAQALACSYARYAIIGGRNASRGEFPYMVSVQQCEHAKCSHYCGGVILTENWILTSAECTREMDRFQHRVYAGLTNLKDQEKQERIVVKHIVPDEFDKKEPIPNYDLGLLKLSSPLVFNDLVKPATLAKQDQVFSGSGIFIGWGSTGLIDDVYQVPDDLQAVDLPIIDYSECIDILNAESGFPVPKYNNSIVCTGPRSGVKGGCDGDGGAPLSQNNVTFGIGSWLEKGCGEHSSMGIYTRISSYLPWINYHINEDLTFQQ